MRGRGVMPIYVEAEEGIPRVTIVQKIVSVLKYFSVTKVIP